MFGVLGIGLGGCCAIFLLYRLTSFVVRTHGERFSSHGNSSLYTPLEVELDDHSLIPPEESSSVTTDATPTLYCRQYGVVVLQCFLCIISMLLKLAEGMWMNSSVGEVAGSVIGWISLFWIGPATAVVLDLPSYMKNYKECEWYIQIFHMGPFTGPSKNEILQRPSSRFLCWFTLLWVVVQAILSLIQCSFIYLPAASQNFDTLEGRDYVWGVEFLLTIIWTGLFVCTTFHPTESTLFGAVRESATDTFIRQIEFQSELARNSMGDHFSECSSDQEESPKKSLDLLTTIQRLVREMTPDLGVLGPALLLVFLEAVLNIVVNILLGMCISVFSPNVDGTFGLASPSLPTDTPDFHSDQFVVLVKISGVLLLVMIATSVASGVYSMWLEMATERMAARLRSKMFASLLQQEVREKAKTTREEIFTGI